MRIAVITEWYSEGLGYAENVLPRTFSRLEHDVDVFTSDLQVYGNASMYPDTYEAFLGPASQPLGVYEIDGYRLHRLARTSDRDWRLVGLEDRLESGKFDLIYGFEVNQELSLQILRFSSHHDTRVFLESRLHKSVYRKESGTLRIRQLMRNFGIGRKVARHADLILPVAEDVKDILSREFKIPKAKMIVQGLGVDDAVFHSSAEDDSAASLRLDLGIRPTDLLCVYTGRLTTAKGVDLLLEAFEELQIDNGVSAHLLLVGDGELMERAAQMPCVTVLGFQKQTELATIYRASDVGVWPRQESTSRYDAAACGVHLVVPSDVGDLNRLPEAKTTFEPGSASDLRHAIARQENRFAREHRASPTGFLLPQEQSWTSIATLISERCNSAHVTRV